MPVTFQRGELVAVVKGANPTLLRKTILQQLEVEKKVLAEGREWKVVSGGHLSNWLIRAPTREFLGLFLTQGLGRMHS